MNFNISNAGQAKSDQTIFTADTASAIAARIAAAAISGDGFTTKAHYVATTGAAGLSAPVLDQPEAQLTPAMTDYILAGLDSGDFSADEAQTARDAINTLNTTAQTPATTTAWVMPTLDAKMALYALLTEVMSKIHQADVQMQSTHTRLYSDSMKAQAEEFRSQGKSEIAKSISAGGAGFLATSAGVTQSISGVRNETRAMAAQEGFKTHDDKTSKLQNNLFEAEKLNATEMSGFKAANPNFDFDKADKEISQNAGYIAEGQKLSAGVTTETLDATQARVVADAATQRIHANAGQDPEALAPPINPAVAEGAAVPALPNAPVVAADVAANVAGVVNPNPPVVPAEVAANGAGVVNPNPPVVAADVPANKAGVANPHLAAVVVEPAPVRPAGGADVPAQPDQPANIANRADAPDRIPPTNVQPTTQPDPANTKYGQMVAKHNARIGKATQELANHQNHGSALAEHTFEGMDGTKHKATATVSNAAHPEAASRGKYANRANVASDVETGKVQQARSQIFTHGLAPLVTGTAEGTGNLEIKKSEATASEVGAAANVFNTMADQNGQQSGQAISARDGFRQMMTEIRNANQGALDAIASNIKT